MKLILYFSQNLTFFIYVTHDSVEPVNHVTQRLEVICPEKVVKRFLTDQHSQVRLADLLTNCDCAEVNLSRLRSRSFR